MKLHSYQTYAKHWLRQQLIEQDLPGAALFLDPGLGKTAIVLHFVEEWSIFDPIRVLVVAPLRVCYTVWPKEIDQWGLTLAYSIVHGGRWKGRLEDTADVYITTPDMLPKLTGHSFDLLVIDESTKFKNWSAKRTKAARRIAVNTPKRIILTGTPSPNSLADLHSQIFLIDNGLALGPTKREFQTRYQVGRRSRYGPWMEWEMKPGAARQIEQRIAPVVLRFDAHDHITMPKILTHDIWCQLPTQERRQYRELEQALIADLESGQTLMATDAGSRYMMCRQFANGGVYQVEGGTRTVVELHAEKITAAADLLEELAGKSLLVFYMFDQDRDRLLSHPAFAGSPVLCGSTSAKDAERIINDWNADRTKTLLAQPQSMSHGLNMQQSSCSDIAWVGLPDSLEIYQQANARIIRQGQQSRQIRIHRILTADTVDRAIRLRIASKDAGQTSLLEALRQ